MFYYIINHTVTAYIQKNQCKKGVGNMISQTFITEYLKLFFPNYDERYLDLLEIISDFTDPYIEASNMAIIALDQNKRIVMVNQLAATLFNTSETAGARI